MPCAAPKVRAPDLRSGYSRRFRLFDVPLATPLGHGRRARHYYCILQ